MKWCDVTDIWVVRVQSVVAVRFSVMSMRQNHLFYLLIIRLFMCVVEFFLRNAVFCSIVENRSGGKEFHSLMVPGRKLFLYCW